MMTAFIYRSISENLRRKVDTTYFSPKRVAKSSLFSTSAPAISTATQKDQEKETRSTWSKLFLFLPGAITFGLGTWQIFRRQEKIRMLEYRQSRLEMEPLKGNQIVPTMENPDTLEFRRVQCRGIFDEKKSIYIGPRSRNISGVTEIGYYLITPLMPILGDLESIQWPILINRGWVPRSWRDKALYGSKEDELSRSSSTPEQESAKKSWWNFWSRKPKILEENLPDVIAVEVTGVVCDSENPSIFVPPNEPGSSQWFYVDVPAISGACGLSKNTPYIEDTSENINRSNPYPVPKDANALVRSSVMPQDHLNYTLTWYSLSAAVTFMAIKRVKPRRSRR